LAGVTAAGAAQSFAFIPLAAILRNTFDVVLPARDRAGLWIAVGQLAVLQAASLLLSWWTRMSALRASQDVIARLRRESVRHLYELPRGFYTDVDKDRLHVTLVYQTSWIESMSNALAAQMLPAALSAGVLFAFLFATQPRYAVIIGVSAPALFAVNRLMSRQAWFRQERLRQAFEQFSRGVWFVLSAMDLTRFQAAEAGELERQNGNIGGLRQVSLEVARFDAVQQLAQTALLLAATIGVVLAGGWAVSEGRGSRGEIMAFYVITALFVTQARALVESVPTVRRGMRAFDELSDLMRRSEREPYQGADTVGSISSVRLENVGFGYPGRRAVLGDATFEIRRGEKAALIGDNGSGKSTLLFLILGFYRPDRGRLSANGVPYDSLDMRSLRARTAIVPQHPLLFGDTVRANVTYGAEVASEEAIWQALERAGATDFVRRLPAGLDQEIGELGVRLSGGQRQRLAIARALLREPDLLILDEPTSNLDEAGVAGLMRNLDRLPFRPAVILVSHERHVVRHAERAFRMSQGRLEEAVEYGA
jgi:ATP-binding cassette subfamily B protein